jgi:hypothetical protein
MKNKPAFRSNFLNSRVLGAWFLFSVATLLAVYAFGAFPAASALGQAANQNQNPGTPPPFKGMVGAHGTGGDPSLPAAQSGSMYPQELEEAIPSVEMGPTHSSFLASWDKVSGATGYRLDVSTSSSFSGYVSGYQDLDVGNVTNRIVSGLSSATTYYYRVRPYTPLGTSGSSNVATATTAATAGLVIHPTFDSTITTNPNSAAIQSMINQAIAIYQSLYRDPITVSILFRYANTGPNGSLLPSGRVSQSNYYVYFVPWNTYITALKASATTGNDSMANASLPTSPLSTNIDPSSAGGRAIGLNTPPYLYANGSVGGTYDGIVTLNSAYPLKFTRPPDSSHYDALEFTEHEIDEVLGLGSRLGTSFTDLRPQDLFSWSAPGTRNLTSTGTRYFSINSGNTNIVGFNQTSPGDFGDWLSPSCPQTTPRVQNAFNCAGQYSDVRASSPEGINLDVIGYDLVTVVTNPATNVASFSATLNGTVNPNGLTTTVYFQYGTTTSYGSTTASHSFTGKTTQSVSANISGLTASTTYHFRIVGTNSGGTNYGADRTFTTLSVTGPPVVTTNPATYIASFSATLNGAVDPHGLTTTVYFQYGTTTSYGLTTVIQSKGGNTYQNVAANISGLSASTTYHFRIVATNSAGTTHGADRTFTTLSATGPPVVTTNPATNVTSSSATLNGTLDPHGLTTSVYFQYGTTTSYGHTTPMQSQTGNTFRNINGNISSLSASTVYHFRIVAHNSGGTSFGSDRTFTTP